MPEKIKRLGSFTLELAWAATILLLPITSLPLLSRLAGGTAVAPASLIPFAWLILVWFVFYLVKRGALPRESLPFLLFISVALIASALAFFYAIPPFKGSSVAVEEKSALLTLVIGSAFYLVSAGWLSGSARRLLLTFKLINISGLIMLLWAALQGVFIFVFDNQYPGFMETVQMWISTRGLFHGRITGLAFEPSWLAQQLNLLFLPLWLAATVTGWSAFRFRLWKFRVENLLLVLGAAVLFVSSRVGTLAFILVLAFLGIYINILLARRLQKWTLARLAHTPRSFKEVVRFLLPVILLLLFITAYGLAMLLLVYGLSHVDTRLARIFQLSSIIEPEDATLTVYQLFNYLAFAERFVYWVAGWKIFNLFPIFGVGLGNAGFFFQRSLPAYSWGLPEVMDTYYRLSFIPNIKSLWIRLLAETGIAGFSAFLAWCLVVLRSAWFMRTRPDPLIRVAGWFGLFVIISFAIEGFSTDTFALPYLWISLGIVSAAAVLVRSQHSIQASAPHTEPPPP